MYLGLHNNTSVSLCYNTSDCMALQRKAEVAVALIMPVSTQEKV